MTGSVANRVPSCAGVVWSASAAGAGATTERGQDKTAHIARLSDGCFCWAFLVFPHIAAMGRNVRPAINLLGFLHLLHIAGQRHGR